ncbi:hypothetical protein G6F32_014945 [Rhizopus arrhizus]|nr:hypothetical protein G6F32_014945 [Rhizopus arrhizus]
MNILNAVHMRGDGACWSTGVGTYVEDVQNALGLDSLDYRFLGYLAIGTPACAVPPANRPDYREFVTEWTGPPGAFPCPHPHSPRSIPLPSCMKRITPGCRSGCVGGWGAAMMRPIWRTIRSCVSWPADRPTPSANLARS